MEILDILEHPEKPWSIQQTQESADEMDAGMILPTAALMCSSKECESQ